MPNSQNATIKIKQVTLKQVSNLSKSKENALMSKIMQSECV